MTTFYTIHCEGKVCPLPRVVTVYAVPHTGFVLTTQEYERQFINSEEQEKMYARWLAGLLDAEVPVWARKGWHR